MSVITKFPSSRWWTCVAPSPVLSSSNTLRCVATCWFGFGALTAVACVRLLLRKKPLFPWNGSSLFELKYPNSPFLTVRLWASIKLLGTILAVTDVSWIKLNWIKVTAQVSWSPFFSSVILGKLFLKTSVSQIRSVLWLLKMINVWISPPGPLWFLFYRLQHSFTH